ncbi:MAG: DUF47 domain-containing protein [Deltaproteobacteria bacterium]|nr:DUF47 domain-containing protein [Deltaproteobacteria bacterium]
MGLFWKKQEKIEEMMTQYFNRCDKCFEMLEKAYSVYMEMGQGEAFEAAVVAASKVESSADDLRRDIEYTLYGKALLPESRGDILGLLETFDTLPNMAETILYSLRCQRIKIPNELQTDFQKLVDVNLQAYYLVRKAVDNLMNNPRVTLHSTKDVDMKESESDNLERDIICKIFSSEMDMGTKILFKDLALLIGEISDRAEKVADRIGIVAIKRQI